MPKAEQTLEFTNGARINGLLAAATDTEPMRRVDTFRLLHKITLASNAAEILFNATNVPGLGNFSHLRLEFAGGVTESGRISMYINSDNTQNNYKSYRTLFRNIGSTTNVSVESTQPIIIQADSAGPSVTTTDIVIFNNKAYWYTVGYYKGGDNAGIGSLLISGEKTSGTVSSFTSLRLAPDTGNLGAGAIARLYGIPT